MDDLDELFEEVSDSTQVDIIRNKLNNNVINIDSESICNADVDLLKDNPFQPRVHYSEDSIFDLALSIKEEGLLQPITIAKDSGGDYFIVYGHRRAKAYKLLNKKRIKAFILKEYDSRSLRTKALIENIQREDMSTIDIAISFESAIANGEYLNQNKLAEAIGKGRSYVTKIIKILLLPKPVLEDLIKNKSINDKYVLDKIRRIENKKDCESIYFWFIKERPSRAGLDEKIASLEEENGLEKINSFKITKTAKGHTLKLPKMNQDDIKKLENFLQNILKIPHP